MTATARYGWVHFDGYAGRTKHRVEILGECVRRGKPHFRVKMLESAYRYSAGQILYPPAWSVTPDDAEATKESS